MPKSIKTAKLRQINKPKDKTFSYKGISAQGKKVTGEINAATLQLARLKLQKEGITRPRLRQKKPFLPNFTNKIKSLEITLFFRQLATMLSAGIPLIQALDITNQNSKNPAFSTIINQIKTDIESGSNFANALGKHKAFSRLSIALVQAGEQSGALDTMLDRIASHQESLEILKNKLKKALQYPALVSIVAIAVTVILLVKVVPIFAKTFGEMGESLPLPTRFIMALSDGLVANFWWIVISVLAISLGLIWYNKKTGKVKLWLDDIALKLPLIAPLIKKAVLVRFSRTLATTFEAGIPLLAALDLSAKATNHHAFIKELNDISTKVNSGQRLSQAMRQSTLFLPMTVQMVDVGEESGKLTEMLNKVADYYDNEVSEQIDGLTSLIEPIIIVILGIIVGGVVIAMYLPIFQIGASVS